MGEGEEHARKSTGLRWLARIRFTMLERRKARQISRELLGIHAEVKAAHSALAGERLYEQIVIRYMNAEARYAKEVLNRAEESFARWPKVRDLEFRDVVLYLIMTESLRCSAEGIGSRLDLKEIVYSVIPADF